MNINAQKYEIVKIKGYGFLAQEEGGKPELHDREGILNWVNSIVGTIKEPKEQPDEDRINCSQELEEKERKEENDIKKPKEQRSLKTVGPVLDVISNIEIYEHPYNELVRSLTKKDSSMPKERKDLIWELKQSLMPKKRYKDTTINSKLTYYLEYIQNNHALYRSIKRKNKTRHTYYWIVEQEQPALPKGETLETIKRKEIHENPFKEINRKYLDKGPVEYIRLLNFFRQYYKVNTTQLKKIEKAYRSYFYETGYRIFTSGDKEKGQVFVTIETKEGNR
jgi:hypothetical protein